MINKYIFPFIFIFSLSCKAQTESKQITDAKWFYYSYAIDIDGYSSSGSKMDPLMCNIKVNSIKYINKDTTKFYFSLYQKDTVNICYLKPYGLIGVMAVNNTLYIPIYHSLVFDKESDSKVLEKMNTVNSLLLKKALEKPNEVNSWLQLEAERKMKEDK